MSDEPVLTVLLLSSLAAAVGALGSLPWALPRKPSESWVGSAEALASGLMLGAGYLLMSRGLDRATFAVVVGAGVGVAYTHWTKVYAGVDAMHEEPEEGRDSGYELILRGALHSAAEGVAIGVAMVLELRLGIFLALALAVHNVAESMALTGVLVERGVRVREAAGLCVVAKVTTPVLALASFALAPVLEGFLAGALGFSAGCLVFLVLTELLPSSYERSANALVSLLVSASAGALVLLEHFFLRRMG